MNLQSVADEIGYSYTTITALISGRIVKDNYLDIAKKINEVLEVNVLPEKPQLPSDEWCGAVRAKLYVKKMNISELSKSIGFNRDKYKIGSTYYRAEITDITINGDGKVKIETVLNPPVSGEVKVTEVQVYNTSGELWWSKAENITKKAKKEGIYYRVTINILEE